LLTKYLVLYHFNDIIILDVSITTVGGFNLEITPEILKEATQRKINSQMNLLKDLFTSDQSFVAICDKHKASLLDLASASINEIFASSGLDLKQDVKVFDMLDNFLETVSKETGLHPSDASLLLTKLFVDIMVQIAALINIQENNKEIESEE
jgi:hypothetical protein